jgi:hypothetical protein
MLDITLSMHCTMYKYSTLRFAGGRFMLDNALYTLWLSQPSGNVLGLYILNLRRLGTRLLFHSSLF